jgi:hypothetical protein
MGLFSSRPKFPGVKENSNGTIEFSLSDEEQRAIDRTIDLFKDVRVHPEAAERVQYGIMAVALSKYAEEMVSRLSFIEQVEYKSKWPAAKADLENSVAAVWKAYSLCQLPIFVYHRACYMEMLGYRKEARKLFASFLSAQSAFKSDTISGVLVQYVGTDIEAAISFARRKSA